MFGFHGNQRKEKKPAKKGSFYAEEYLWGVKGRVSVDMVGQFGLAHGVYGDKEGSVYRAVGIESQLQIPEGATLPSLHSHLFPNP